jgi:hypothetical protein
MLGISRAGALRAGAMALAALVCSAAVALAAGHARRHPRKHSREPSVISACVARRTGVLAVKGRCARGARRLRWNIQGPAGPRGPQGPAGPRGPQGPAGPQGPTGAGFTFTETTGNPGPTLSAGNYFIDAIANLDNSNSSSPLVGLCAITTSSNSIPITLSSSSPLLISQAFDLTAYLKSAFSFATIATLTSKQQLMLSCESDSGSSVSPTGVTWWVSPVGS